MSEQFLTDKLLENLPLGIAVWRLQQPDDDGSLCLAYANAAAAKYVGLDLKSRAGSRAQEIFPADMSAQYRAWADICRKQVTLEISSKRLGELRNQPASYGIRCIPLGDWSTAFIFEDISDLRRAELEARSLSHFFDSIVEHIPAKIFLKDAKDLTFKKVNRAAEEMLGMKREELLGKNDHDFFPKEQADFFVRKDREVLAKRALEDIPEEPIETRYGMRWLHTRKIGIFDEIGEPQYLLGISIDITDRKRADELLRASHQQLERDVVERTLALDREMDQRRLAEEALSRTEEQLRHAQKMEAIGRLAGGIAHDFNNLLTIVLSYCDLIQQDTTVGERLQRVVREIRAAGVRAADLTQQLLAFSRQQVLQPRILNLNDVVGGMRRMMERLLGEDVELVIRAHEHLSSVKADPSQLEQVIMNLVVNARDAMPTGGKLLIETDNVDVDQRYVEQHLGSNAGPHVMLAVSDTGIGMDRATLSRVFEPFFTTKERIKGTGLGLSTVFGIVKQSGGFTWVYSEPGKGATFKVYLPVTKGHSVPPPGPEQPGSDLEGSETILLVEDEDAVREVAATMLRHHGYTVLEASRPSEAIALAASQTARVHLLLTDVVMPEMGGRSLAEKLSASMPDLKILFMSGYTDDAIVHHGVLESGVAFLQKPFTMEALLRRIRETLTAQHKSRRPPH